LEQGIPDVAFDPIEGDDKKIASAYKRRNQISRGGQQDLFAAEAPADYSPVLAAELSHIDAMPDDSPETLATKQDRYTQFAKSTAYAESRRLADAFCSSFVWPMTPGAADPVTQTVYEGLRDGRHPVSEATASTITRLASEYNWFHWHIEFPDVFGSTSPQHANSTELGWRGGFSCVIGNPPWEQIELEEKEFFSVRDPRVAEARNASERKSLIAQLERENPSLLAEYETEKRRLSGIVHFVRDAGRYPLTATGRPNTYKLFAEAMRSLVADLGRVGAVLPTSIATDDTTKVFFRAQLESGSLVSLYDFENKRGIFPAVGSVFHFCLMTMAGSARREAIAEFAFNLYEPSQTSDESRTYTLSATEVARVSPLSRTAPMFASRQDADVALRLYASAGALN
ncbi:MAG: SAM-dependent DNA methyltransferase, partial [Coriobacteriia bacterium]|nr:SAM-dependent DNA methyltransferase [Coriobacteriia bacterium]